MTVSPRWFFLPLVAVAILALFAGATSRTEAQEAQNEPAEAQLVEELRDEGANVQRHSETGEVRFVGATKANPISRPEGLSVDASAEEAARAHLARYGKLFGIGDQQRELRADEAENVGQGRASVHFQQVYENVPVFGGEINAEVDEANNLLVATGETLPGITLDTEPGIGAGEAREAALGKIAKDRELGVGDLETTKPELWIHNPSLLGGPGPRVTRLVWRLEVNPEGDLDDFRELVLVDAKIGAVLLNFDQVHNVRNRQTHTANSTSALPGTLLCSETTNPCAPGNSDANLAHVYSGNVYDFYSTNHGRDSLDNAGMVLRSTVDFCPDSLNCPYQNAFWNGEQMVYGDGFSAADDVVGHELTHGVTDFESSLFYYYQSGAINESFSDIWGEFVDQTNGSGADTAAVKWKLGEDVPVFGAIRDMKDPMVFGDPDRTQSPNYFADPNEQDSGGVHYNSGVNNKAAYLMTDGATFNGKTVTGLGIPKVAKIFYEAQTNLLTSGSDYQDLHATLQQACANLTGTSGITAADCAEVKDAVDATEMHLTPANAPAPEAPVCATGQTAVDLFNDNLENTSSGNWTKTGNWFYPQNPNLFSGFNATYATSGTTNMWGYNQPTIGDYSITKSTNVTPPTGKTTYLRFRHSHGFEDDSSSAYDGGVLEYSTNGGSSWTDAGSLITDNGYNGTISSTFGNPLGSRQAYVRESNGYISSRVNLSSLAGQSVKFRFRIGTDSAVDDYGWFIDDVRVYTCEAGGDTIPPDTTITSGPSGTVSSTSASFGFTSTESGSTFQCKLDGGAFGGCSSPKSYTNLSNGSHTFQVRATDAAGNTDASPAARTWTIQADTVAPTVTSVSPAAGRKNVARATNVTATFSEAMNEASVEALGVVTLVRQGTTTRISAVVTYDPATKKVTLNPNANLARNTVYVVRIKGGSGGAKDAAGNALAADKTWTFKTGTR